MPRLSLRAKFLASFAIILLPVLGLLIYGYREAGERQVAAILNDQMQTAQAVSAIVDARFDEALAVGWVLASDPLVYTLDPSQIDPYLHRLTPHFPQYETIGVANADGDSVGSSLPYPSAAQRMGLSTGRPYFQQLMTTGQPTISEVLVSRRTSRPTIVIAVPLRTDDGKTVGAIVVTLYLEALARQLESVALRPGQHIVLVDRTGTAAFHTALKELPWEERNLSQFEPVRAGLEGRSGEVRRFVSPVTGDTRIGAFTPTPKYGWVVGVTIREDVALAPVLSALRDQLLGFGAIALLTVGLALTASYALLRPVRQLTNQALALGRGDLTRRVDIHTGDEMERLGQTFNQMAEHLSRTLEERQALGQVAEALVREQTLERVADVIAEQVQRVLRAQTVALFLAAPQRAELRLIAHRGLSAQTVSEVDVVPYSATSLTALAARTGQLQTTCDITSLGPELSLARQVAEREGQHSVFSQPLIAKGVLVGVVTIGKPVHHHLTEWEYEFLLAFADLCAVAIENARLYEEVRETLHLHEEFLSAAAHELKTPVAPLRGFAQLLMRSRAARPPEEQQALEVIERQTGRITRLAEDLLETVRPSARPLDLQTVDLAALAEEELQEAARASARHQMMLCRPGPVLVNADPALIRRVLLTLLDNAMRFSPQGGRIEMTVTTHEGMALASVRDYGLGIQKDRQRYVFEPFYEPFPAGTPGYYGATGLGLYVVKTVIDRHGGRMWFESQEGKGSTFFFTLPLQDQNKDERSFSRNSA